MFQQEDAKRIVQYSKYPPVGSRGFGPMFAPVILGHSTESDYAEQANEQLMVIVQMESKGGVNECEKIAQVEGVDCLFIGRCCLRPFISMLTTDM
jgi:4-hydroxy-2-oxoheptanedioate aldolase